MHTHTDTFPNFLLWHKTDVKFKTLYTRDRVNEKSVTTEIIEDQDISNSNVWFKKCVTHVWYVVHAVLPTGEYGIHTGMSYNERNKAQTGMSSVWVQRIVQNINMGKVNSATYNNGSVFDATVNINTLTSINRTHINVAAQFNSIQFI